MTPHQGSINLIGFQGQTRVELDLGLLLGLEEERGYRHFFF